jgi:hypothetical protein
MPKETHSASCVSLIKATRQEPQKGYCYEEGKLALASVRASAKNAFTTDMVG